MNASKISIFSIVFLLLVLSSCEESTDKDEVKPAIELSFSGAFPQICDTVFLGDKFNLKVKLTDNNELGSFSVDIHHNFDHHGHSTEIEECDLWQKKDAVDPVSYLKNYTIPDGETEYMTDYEIEIPAGKDEGDYHLSMALVDKAGWQTIKILSIKVLERKEDNW